MKRIFFTVIPLVFLTVLVLSACSSNSLAGTSWTLVSYGDPAAPTAAVSGVDTSLDFARDGTLGGSMGCNSFGGDYKVKGSQIIFGSLFSTEMACDEPRMSQETGTFAVMSGTATYTLNGESLTITSTDGSWVMNLTKK